MERQNDPKNQRENEKMTNSKNIELESETLASIDRRRNNLFPNSRDKQRNVRFILPGTLRRKSKNMKKRIKKNITDEKTFLIYSIV